MVTGVEAMMGGNGDDGEVEVRANRVLDERVMVVLGGSML